MTSQPRDKTRDKTRDSTKHDTAKFGIDLYCDNTINAKYVKMRVEYSVVPIQ